MTSFRDTSFRTSSIALLAAVSILAAGAFASLRAQSPPMDERTIRALLPGIEFKRGEKPGMYILGEWREPELTPTATGFRLHLLWNGVDNEKWPFEEIVAALSSSMCGPVSPAVVKARMNALYKSRSLIREVELGGNAGTTFRKRLATQLGSCKAQFDADGSRWHTLTAVVTRP